MWGGRVEVIPGQVQRYLPATVRRAHHNVGPVGDGPPEFIRTHGETLQGQTTVAH